MNPEPFSLGNRPAEIRTHIDFFVRSDDLCLDAISVQLGIQPTYGFEARARYLVRKNAGDELPTVERRRPAFGIWHYSTNGRIEHDALEDHASFILKILEPSAQEILQLRNEGKYTIAMICWHVGPSGFQLSSSVLTRLARLTEWISFTCWETEEEFADENGVMVPRRAE